MRKSIVLVSAALIIGFGSPAYALNSRTWLSGSGADQEGCGAIATPCRTLQFAHDQTGPRGEINFKDSAGYGSVVITKAISIVANGAHAGILAPSGSDAITINAGQYDTVVLRNLMIEGANVGTRGVVYNTGANLEISGCVIQGFVFTGSSDSGSGIVLRPRTGRPSFVIADTTIAHNTNAGLHLNLPDGSTATPGIIIDRMSSTDNVEGIRLEYRGNISAAMTVNVRNSIMSRNYIGIYAGVSNMKLSIDNVAVDANVENGVYIINAPMSVTIGRSSISNNGKYGIYSAPNSVATVLSYGDNRISGNDSDVYGGNGSIGKITPQ